MAESVGGYTPGAEGSPDLGTVPPVAERQPAPHPTLEMLQQGIGASVLPVQIEISYLPKPSLEVPVLYEPDPPSSAAERTALQLQGTSNAIGEEMLAMQRQQSARRIIHDELGGGGSC